MDGLLLEQTRRAVEMQLEEGVFQRIPIKTHFVTVGENYFDLIDTYVVPHYQPGDVLVMSEKVVSLCQKRVVYKKDLKVTWLARLLSRFATRNPAGPAMDNVYKMQVAINLNGRFKTLLAAVIGGIGKLFGVRGLFYKILGPEVAGIDGFCVVGFEYYADKGILTPENPSAVCNEIKQHRGIDCIIVDANDLGVTILGKNRDNPYSDELLKLVIKDNPAGQGNEQTPFVLVREIKQRD